MVIVEMKDVCKNYVTGKENVVHALKHANLQVDKGEFVSIIGPSGSGKSTMLNLLGGLEKPNEGVIQINGKRLDKMKEDELAEFRRLDIGFVFQKFNLIPMLNVRENIELPLRIGNDPVNRTYIDELIHFLGLQERESHMPGELSGGQQQRVCIGRALATRSSILLADEPTGNLDRKTSAEIMQFLKNSVRDFGQTIIMITHDEELAGQTDRMVHIVDGELFDNA